MSRQAEKPRFPLEDGPPDLPKPARIVDDPAHPALNGRYAAGRVEWINYHWEVREAWQAVEIFLTLRCPLACRHCITNSHPGRPEEMDGGLLVRLIDGLADLGKTRYVCLFGGEPLSVPALLLAGIEACRKRGLLPSINTAGYWAATAREARSTARLLRGLNHVIVSTDRAHGRYLGMDTVVRAVEACKAEGIHTSVNYVAEEDEFAGRAALPEDLFAEALRLGVGVVVTPCSDGGRAAGRSDLVAALPLDAPCGKLDVPLVGCDGDVYSCGPAWAIPAEGQSRHLLGRYPDQSLRVLFGRRYGSERLNRMRTKGPLDVARELARGVSARESELATSMPSSPCGVCQVLARWTAPGALYWSSPSADATSSGDRASSLPSRISKT